MAEIEDQLFALSQSSNAGDDIKKAWGNGLRLHTAFGRLASYTSAGEHVQRPESPHSCYALAEAGLVAVHNEHSTVYRLWNSANAFVTMSDLIKSKSVPEAIKLSHQHAYEELISRF